MKNCSFLFLCLIAVLGLFIVGGCSTTTVSTPKDPGRIVSPEVTVSGAASYNSTTGIVDVNLNAILVGTGDAASLGKSNFQIFVGTNLGAITDWTNVDITIPAVDNRPMDMVFILDNTGSMSGRIKAVKDSIVAFTSTLEAAGVDAKFGIVSFGDTSSESSSLNLPASAEGVATWLDALVGVDGGDSPENPLTAMMLAFNTFSWRTGAQRVLVVITDNPCHQLGDGTSYTDYTIASVQAALSGRATVYAVSPKIDQYSTTPKTFSAIPTTESDVRLLADGYGWYYGISQESYGIVKSSIGTGGRWIELPNSGNIDLNTLGISTTVTAGYTLRFSYTFIAGTWYIHILVDTDKDGVLDSDLLITLAVSACGVTSVGDTKLTPLIGVKPGAAN
jgi:hypothetical protein